MIYKLLSIVLLLLVSCKAQKNDLDDQTTIASKVSEAQLKYLNNTIFNYSRISNTGNYYFKENTFLEKKIEEFKEKIRTGYAISEGEQALFFDHFDKTFKNFPLTDSSIFNQLKKLPIKTTADVDILNVYIKQHFVGILLNNKLLPFTHWSTMASSKKWTISNGEEFLVELATTAFNPNQQNEWFLITEDTLGLTKENIVDTLYPNSWGVVEFKTKHYKRGKNHLTFISRLNLPTEEIMVSREVIYYVK